MRLRRNITNGRTLKTKIEILQQGNRLKSCLLSLHGLVRTATSATQKTSFQSTIASVEGLASLTMTHLYCLIAAESTVIK